MKIERYGKKTMLQALIFNIKKILKPKEERFIPCGRRIVNDDWRDE